MEEQPDPLAFVCTLPEGALRQRRTVARAPPEHAVDPRGGAAPEGVAEVSKHHPDATIHVGVLDRALNARKYILPGLGDFGDRLYGT